MVSYRVDNQFVDFFIRFFSHFTSPADIFLTIQCINLITSIVSSIPMTIEIIAKKSDTGNSQSAVDKAFLKGASPLVNLAVTSGSATGNRVIIAIRIAVTIVIMPCQIIMIILNF